MSNLLLPVLVASAALCGSAYADTMSATHMTDEQIIASAESAAPPSVGKAATIMAFDAQMNMRTLREGTNGFTCMPDVPETPGPDPMCLDKGGMAWLEAWATHTDPPKGVVGIAYMLAGGSDPDNMDPFATKPAAGMEWVTTGPHLMLFNIGSSLKDYPTSKQPDTTTPYVMYPDTPYAHVMMPVQ